MKNIATILNYALRESLRRRVFHVGIVLTVIFLSLYALGCSFIDVKKDVYGGLFPAEVDVYAAATVLGLAVFAIYFLGVSLAIFLSISVVRGDAEQGVLQAIVVRPLARWQFLAGRILATIVVTSAYVAVVFTATVLITDRLLGWAPENALEVGVEIAAAIAVISIISTLGSIFLSGLANGIGVFMFFGAGLFGGLLGEVGDAIGSPRLEQTATVMRYAGPFEWFYQSSLGRLIEGESTVTQTVIKLGPFGGSVSGGAGMWLWAAVYVLVAATAATIAFGRRDL